MAEAPGTLLAIDTSTSSLKLALSFGEDRLVMSEEAVDRSHGRVLMRKLENLFDSAGASRRDLEGIVVASGPGSFTGLRIALAVAKGMAVALNIPVVGVSLYEVAAYVLRNHTGPVLVVMQVRRGEYLVATVSSGTVDLLEVVAVPEEQLAAYIGAQAVTSIGLNVSRLMAEAEIAVPQLEVSPADLLLVGRQKLARGEAADIAKLEPLYFGKSQAEIRFEQRHGQAGE